MLLPSDIARLVLGYLQQEGLTATSRTFIFESPNLKEYAEHSTEDGLIPACVFSLFGKNLSTVLNEYVAVKAKETSQDTQVPAMMTSLWKKLDFTLNQIKCMQNSPALQQSQRLRSKMRRQRALTPGHVPGSGYLTLATPGHCMSSPAPTPQGVLVHSTPVCYTAQQTQPTTLCISQLGQVQDGSRLAGSVSRDSPLQILVPDQRLTAGPLSPGRRKCDSPRRRGWNQYGGSGAGRGSAPASSTSVEPHTEEAVSENFPQMVIENAREKILNDRSLQEKLAENINKILASDNSPQVSKAACTVEQDQSIDEILGLQGEIHMTDDAIQDILEQTESDPAFQALFDLFDCSRGKSGESNDQASGSLSDGVAERDETAQVDDTSETVFPGPQPEAPTSEGQNSSKSPRSRNAVEAKSKRRSSAPPQHTSKASPAIKQSCPAKAHEAGGPGGTGHIKKGTSRTKAGGDAQKQTRGKSSNPQNAPSSCMSEEDRSMEIDGPLRYSTTEKQDLQNVPECAQHVVSQSHQDTAEKGCLGTIPNKASESNSSVTASGVTNEKESEMVAKQTCCRPGPPSASAQTVHILPFSSLPSGMVEADKTVSKEPSLQSRTALPDAGAQKMTPKEPQPHGGDSTPRSGASSLLIPVSANESTPSALPCVSTSQSKDHDPSKIVSLKIIISDEPEESSSDHVLNQAVSSIISEKIPTIFLSSPAKSPAKGLTSASANISQEETAQAVSILQGADVAGGMGSPSISSQESIQLQPQGVVQKQQEASFIQLLPANANSPFGGTSNYFVMADPSGGPHHSNVLVLPNSAPAGPVSAMPHVVATPPRSRAVVSVSPDVSQAYSTGSTIIISSPVQPMLQSVMVPLSVVGQNNAGNFTVVPNRVLALPCPTTAAQPSKVKSKPKLAPKDFTDSGRAGPSGPAGDTKGLSQPSQSLEKQRRPVGSSPGHRRMLCFDVTDAATETSQYVTQVNKTSPNTTAATSSLVQKCTDKDNAGRPQQLVAVGSSRAKRRVATVRLSEPSVTRAPENTPLGQQQKDGTKGTPSDKPVNQAAKCTSSTKTGETQQDPSPSPSPESSKKPSSSGKGNGETELKDAEQNQTSSAQDHRHRVPGTLKDDARQEPCDRKLAGAQEASPEPGSAEEQPHVSANKENELDGSQREQRQPSLQPSGDGTSPAVGPPTPLPHGVAGKTLCKTSPLTKQAAEMLHDIQGQKPPTTPLKKQGSGCLDLPLPRTPGPGYLKEDFLDGLRTPSRLRPGRDNEGTPRLLPPPTTPDLPSCSPASEAGSENSINMAAHTLMILSRAARAGGPLKDLRQEEAGAGKHAVAKGKKRKQAEPSPPLTKELQFSGSSGSKKKAKKQKKLLDSFPDNLDVDKFLSSLHYDE